VEHLKVGQALELLTNIRPSWKGLPGTDTLAYDEHFKITSVKSFITLDPVEVRGIRRNGDGGRDRRRRFGGNFTAFFSADARPKNKLDS
jgi:hypothetical protein